MMKQKRLFKTLFVLLLVVLGYTNMQAQGTVAGDAAPYAVLSENTNGGLVLTFYCDDQKTARNGMDVGPFENAGGRGWENARTNITTVVFDDSFANCTELTSTAFWFYGCDHLTEIVGISNLKTDNVTNMEWMFRGCSGLTILDVSGFKTENVFDFGLMFMDCSSLTSLDISNFKTDNMLYMNYMFYDCSGLTTLDMSNFKTDKVTAIDHMFYNCSGLTTIYAGNDWTTAAVTSGEDVFAGCTNLVGGKGTAYNPDHTDYTYARIDGGPNSQTPGYFTKKGDAPWVEPNALVLTGKIDNYWYDETGNPDGFEAIIINVPLPPGEVSIWENNVLNTFIENKLAFTTQNGEPVDNVTGRILFTEKGHWKTIDGGRILIYEDANMQGEVAEIDPEWGMIRILNTDVTWSLLSATDRYVSLPLCVKAYIGDDEMPLTNGSFTVMLTKPLSIESISLVEISFENSEEVSVPLDELIHLQDWRNKQLVRNDSPDLYEYYRVDSPMITGTENGEELNKIIMTDLGSPDGSLHSLSEMAPDLAVSYNPDLNHGMLTFVNNGGQLGSFTIFVPVTINHEWGYLSGQVIIKVHEGDMPADAEPYAVLSDNNTVLKFYYDEKKAERNGMDVGPFNNDSDRAWYSQKESIISVTIDDTFANCTTVTSTAYWFYECKSLTTITGINNLKTDNVTNMSGMFSGCYSLTSLDVSGFKTDNVTDMSYMFENCLKITELDVSGFETDNVESMYAMFRGCANLTSLDVSHFNTEKVKSMYGMFNACSELTSLDVSNFNTSNVTDMWCMFSTCTNLESLDVTNFNTEKVTGINSMFSGCRALTSIDVSNFKTDNMTNMGYLFEDCTSLTSIDISNFNTANVMNMNYMFNGCTNLTTIYTGEGWNTEKVEYGLEMFSGCAALVGGKGTHYDPDHTDYTYARIDGGPNSSTPGYFTQSGEQPWVEPGTPEPYAVLSDNNTVLTFYYDEHKAERNGMDIGPFGIESDRGWNDYCENITTAIFDGSFANCTSLTSTRLWFTGCQNLTAIQDLSNLKTDNVTDMRYMFKSCSSLTSLDVSGFKTDNVTNMGDMFFGCSKLTTLDLSNFNTSQVKYMYYMFSFCSELTSLDVSNFNTENVESMVMMFEDCSSLTSLNVSSFKTENVTKMGNMFNGCSGLTSLDVSNFNTSNVTDMSQMFSGCSSLTSLDVSNFNTSNVTNMSSMFGGCSKLTSLDVSNFNTSNVTTMGSMFSGCSKLTTLDVSNFNTSNVTHMSGMFYGCSSLTSLDLSNFNTENVKDMSGMFSGCSGLTSLDLSNFNTSNVIYDTNDWYSGNGIRSMFEGCSALTTIWVSDGWTTANLTESPDVFKGCTSLVGGKGTHYDPDHIDYTYARIDGGPDSETPGYFTRKGDAPWVEPGTPEPYAVLSDNNTKLTFFYDTDKDARGGMDVGPFSSSSSNVVPWYNQRENITAAEFASSFANCTSITSTAYWFDGCNNMVSISGIQYLNTANVTNMHAMFLNCSSLTNLDVSGFNTENVTDMSYMFHSCSSLTSLNVSHFNTANVTDMSYMFDGCSSLTSLDVRGFSTTNVTNMGGMFWGCSALTSFDVSHFNTANVTDMRYVFSACSSLTSLDVSGFNTENVTDMSNMFERCFSLTSLDLSNFNTSNVTNTQGMFYGCSNLVNLDIRTFDMSKVNNEEKNMFVNCSSLASIIAGSANILTEEYAKIGNPNLLVYVNEARLAPEGVQNVVVNGVAKEIVLKDAEGNNNWYCPEPFRAEKISYTREFRQQTQIGISRGWESLALPFAVQTITHQDKGVIAPFGSDASGLHFWLRRLGHEGLISVQMIEPNAPYIISMPNSEDYASRFNLNGRVTFAAQDAYVERTEQMADESGDYMMVPAFQRMAVSEDIYALNVGEERNGRPEGSIFERNYREVRPFEAYTVHRGDRPAPLFVDLSDLEGSTTDVPDVRWMMDDGNGEWYDLQGRKLGSTLNVQRSTLKKGVYIHNGRKTVVR